MNVYHDTETGTLVEQCRRGNSDALHTLYVNNYTPMLETARRYVDNDTARDMVHDSFLMALTSLDTLRDTSRVEAWLTRIVRNMAINHIKHEHVLQLQPVETVQDIIPAEQNDEPIVPLDMLMKMVERLPSGYEQVFRLRTLAGLSHDEISRRLGITSSTSRSQYTHARRMLRSMIQQWWVMLITIVLGSIIYLYQNSEHSRVNTPDNPETAQQQTETPVHGIDKPEQNLPTQGQKADTPSLKVAAISEMPPKDTPDSLVSTQPDQSTEQQPDQPGQDQPQSPTSLPPLSIDPVMQPQLARGGANQHSTLPVSVAMSVSGLPDRFNQSNAATITGISSLEPIDSQTANPQPIDFDNWTDYFYFINEEAEINPTEENRSLLRIAGSNALGNPQQSIEEHAQHDVPFTLGLSISKALNNRWSLATGLNYSRLHSTFEMGYNQAFISNEQTIHYLGVPVNATYTLLQSGRWTLYGSAGVALDLPVGASRHTRHVLNGQTIFSRNNRLSVPLQWSVNAGAGVQFNITPHIGIFAQPGVNYYFDNGTKTIRAAHPWSMTVPVGLRFTW